MNRVKLLALALVTLSLASVAPVRAQDPVAALPSAEFTQGEVVVRFRDTAARAARAAAVASVAGTVSWVFGGGRWTLVRTPLEVPVAVARLRLEPAVAVAEPNYRGFAALTPDDRCIGGCDGARQWNIDAINARLGWDVVPGTFYTAAQKAALPDVVTVAVLDSKIDESLGDWVNKTDKIVPNPADARSGGQLDLANAIDYVPAALREGPSKYHGSFIAGLLGASANNGVNIAGVAYGAKILPITVLDGNGATTAAILTDAITYAASKGARVINLSIGLAAFSNPVQDAINKAFEGGALVVAAAGNYGNDQPFYPAWMDNVMAVVASDEADRPLCSNHNSRISVAAPGAHVVSLDPSSASGLSIRCGTSAATPQVSGLAALLFAQDPARTPTQVRRLIESTSDDDVMRAGRDDFMGHGRINVERALRAGAAQVKSVEVAVPPPAGGVVTARAYADASAAAGVDGAELFVGKPVAPGAGTPMLPADGQWGGREEHLVATVQVKLSDYPATGVQRIYVRAFDGTTWGPAASGVLIIDRTPPQVTITSGTDAQLVPATAGKAATVSFRATDDYSSSLQYEFAVSPLTPAGPAVYRSSSAPLPAGSSATATWQPGATDRGRFRFTITVRDAAGNASTGVFDVTVL